LAVALIGAAGDLISTVIATPKLYFVVRLTLPCAHGFATFAPADCTVVRTSGRPLDKGARKNPMPLEALFECGRRRFNIAQ
jgi:hypothetical protein